MYARLCSTTGWTWEYVGQCVTLPRLYAFLDYWNNEAPPVAESVAAYLGINRKKGTAGQQARSNAAETNAYMQNAPRRIVKLPQ